jgi:hypothetical protein
MMKTASHGACAIIVRTMAKYEVGFDGRWQETFDDCDQAIQWAQEVADTGRTVDVVLKRRFLPRRFLTAFPESELAARKAAWSVPWTHGGALSFGGSG